MSIYGIHKDGRRVGTVMKIMGEPAKSRWWAFASEDRKKGFPTMSKAADWLTELDTDRTDEPASPSPNPG